MSGTEALSVEALYELELALLRYPGLRLERILDNAVLHCENEETGEPEIVFNAFLENMLVLGFRGPAVEELGRTACFLPMAASVAEDGGFGFVVEEAVRALETLVEERVVNIA